MIAVYLMPKVHSISGVVVLLGCLFPLVAVAQSPSFDCKRAGTEDELAICADAGLSSLEAQYADAYSLTRQTPDRDKARAIAKSTLRKRHDCRSDQTCIEGVLTAAISEFSAMTSKASSYQSTSAALDEDGMPAHLGECINDRILEIRARLGDNNFDNGTEIKFQGGGFETSYLKEPAAIASSVNDPVEICLVSVPDGCPEGDNRGRNYQTTNLATNQSWTLANSQHMCGGA